MVRLTNEARANRVQADIWRLVDGVGPLIAGRHRRAVRGAEREGTAGEPRSTPTGAGSRPTSRVRSLAYNTTARSARAGAAQLSDLLDPRFKGKIVWNPKSMTGAWGFISTVIKRMGEEKGMAYLRALAKQEIVPLPMAIRAVLDRVIAGEYAIGLEMNNTHAAISAAQGAPVAWVPLNPVSDDAAGRRHHHQGAPHPNAARLFLDFMVSRAGQEVFRDRDYMPMHPDVPAKNPKLKPETGRLQGDRLQSRGSRHQRPALGRRSSRNLPLEACDHSAMENTA